MAKRKLFSTSCDGDGNLQIELTQQTVNDLKRAEFICINLAKSIPALAVLAAETANALSDIVADCQSAHGPDDDTDVDEIDEDDVFEPSVDATLQCAGNSVVC